MNASVQLVTAPWSGYSTSPGASALGLKGGGAHTPVWHGSGFNWGSIVGFRAGGPISTVIQNPRGQQMTAAFVRGFPGGLRGLGQVDIQDPLSTDIGTQVASDLPYSVANPPVVFSPPTNVAPAVGAVLGPIATAAGAIGQQYMSYQNPLFSKQTVALSPSGQVVYATNQPTAAGALTSASGAIAGMLPILLIGGLVLMMVARK